METKIGQDYDVDKLDEVDDHAGEVDPVGNVVDFLVLREFVEDEDELAVGELDCEQVGQLRVGRAEGGGRDREGHQDD